MRKLYIAVIDLITNKPEPLIYSRIIRSNYSSIMTQIVATWCEEEGHTVRFLSYTGTENILEELPTALDIAFISAFTQSAQMAYALSNLLQSRGAITVLGGPHSRCYPEDARLYFDFVVGFADREVIVDILKDCSQHRPLGIYISSKEQLYELPGLRARWKFAELALRKTHVLKIVPMISSLGCPYHCSFCIDSSVPFRHLDFEEIKNDLRFLLQKTRRPLVGWQDPNFGVRFNYTMDALEEAVPPGSIRFIAESSLSILSEPNLKRLEHNGFVALLPGIESWSDFGSKTNSGIRTGVEKVRNVSQQVNTILRFIPYVGVNFIFGLDCDEGPEPFELTKEFLDKTPGVYPSFVLLTVFGQATPLNLEYQSAKRVLPIPFHFLSNETLNVKLKNYTWTDFYDRMIDLTRYAFSWRSIGNRYRANNNKLPRLITLLRSLSPNGDAVGRIKYYTQVRQLFVTDQQFRRFYDMQSTTLPEFFERQIRDDLGTLWEWLPAGSLLHDPNIYYKSVKEHS